MGLRSQTESVARIYRAFQRERTWTQADLAREVGITVGALRKRLDELTTLGMPLERQEDSPHVYWSVPKAWFPGGFLFSDDDLDDLLHVLWHAPRSRRRDRLFRALLGAARKLRGVDVDVAIVTPQVSEAEEAFLPVLEESLSRRQAARVRFYSRERRAIETRHISVHRVDVGPPARLVGTCHRTGDLRWFRVDNIVEAKRDDAVPFRPANDADVDRFLSSSIDGFREADHAEQHAFLVRHPEARWVEKNLLHPMEAVPADGGIVVKVRTAGVLRVARYVVGLGAAARPETPELARLVEELARGALGPRRDRGSLAKTRGETAERSRRRANR